MLIPNEISNPSLFMEKLNLLSDLNSSLKEEEFQFSISCNYHGINLNFKTKSQNLINTLSKIIPAEWFSVPIEDYNIYLIDPSELDYSEIRWSEEVLQDCISYDNNTKAVQRDFASIISSERVVLICEDKVGDGFYNFLRWYLSEKLMDRNKYVVHASCVLGKDNLAHLFLGHSGAGKTTITKLSSPRQVLGDDMNIISLVDGILYVEAGAIGGQFNSMIGYDKKIKLKACYWLNQSSKNEKILLDVIIANQKLLASFANLNWPTLEQNKVEQLLCFSQNATNSTTFYQLNFKNNSDIWNFLDS